MKNRQLCPLSLISSPSNYCRPECKFRRDDKCILEIAIEKYIEDKSNDR